MFTAIISNIHGMLNDIKVKTPSVYDIQYLLMTYYQFKKKISTNSINQ